MNNSILENYNEISEISNKESDKESNNNYTDKYYTIELNEHKFQIQIIHKEKPQFVILDMKGHRCIDIYVQIIADEPRLYLSQVLYRPSCTIGKVMDRGTGTVNMIKALLITVMKQTDFDKVFLRDKSTIDCIIPPDNTSTIPISLPTLHFIIQGNTWYEHYFNAQHVDLAKKEAIDISNKMLLDPIKKDILDKFIEVIVREQDYYDGKWYSELMKVAIKYMNDSFEKNMSWRRLFYELFSKYGVIAKELGSNRSCMLFQTLEEIITTEFKIPCISNLRMYITRDTIMKYPEWNVKLNINDSPVHKSHKIFDKIRKNILGSNVGIFTVGGKHTRTIKDNRLKSIPSYSHRIHSKKGTKKNRTVQI